MPACWVIPISVPAVSKKVTNRKVRTTMNSCGVLMSFKWKMAWPNVGAILGAVEMIPWGSGIWPMHIPKIAVMIIPIKIDPGTRAAIRIAVKIKPNRVNQTSGLPNEPRPTRDDELLTINFPFCKPMKAINNPIPQRSRIWCLLELHQPLFPAISRL